MILRDYQGRIAAEAAALLRSYNIAYLSMQVRTGKTITAMHAADSYGAKSVLFITKKKAISSIKADYMALAPSFNMQVTNYEAVHKVSGEFDLVILDEAHCLGQFPKPAKRIGLLKELCKNKPIIYLSGTPTPESYSQIYHQLYVSSFSPFKEASFYRWADTYVIVMKKYVFNRQLNDYSRAMKYLIIPAIEHLFISYTQEQAGFDMAVQEEILYVKMKDATYNLANYIKDNRVYISDGREIIADTEVKLMGKLHQIYSGTVIDEMDNVTAFDDSKIVFIKRRFKGKKIAIFYKYRGEELLIRRHFTNVTTSPDEFNASKDMVFISQVQSGREGINLSTADCLVMVNIDFSAVSYWQARARLQTKDRDKEAKVFWVFAKDGIEGRIYNAVMNKRDYTLNYFKKDYGIKRGSRSSQNKSAA